MERATSILYLSAHQMPFLETAHILWGVNGFYSWACMAYLFVLSSDVPSPAVQSTAACYVLQRFEDILIGHRE